MKPFALLAPAAALALAACAPATNDSNWAAVADPAAAAAAPAVVAPTAAAVPVTQISGLQERAPDACKGSTYVPYLGQPGSLIPTMGITREYRVVQWRGIEPQEYNPLRIVFRLDAAGNIYNIDCG